MNGVYACAFVFVNETVGVCVCVLDAQCGFTSSLTRSTAWNIRKHVRIRSRSVSVFADIFGSSCHIVSVSVS